MDPRLWTRLRDLSIIIVMHQHQLLPRSAATVLGVGGIVVALIWGYSDIRAEMSSVPDIAHSRILEAAIVGGILCLFLYAAFGLLTGQIGFAANNVLFYVKGGAAVTDDRFRGYAVGTNILATNTASDTRWGGTVGAGLEFGFTPNWSAAIEYDHLFMGNRTYTFTTNLTFSVFAQWNSLNDFVRLNARLHWIPRIGTDLFLVFDQSHTPSDHIDFARPTTRSVVGKLVWRVTF